MNPLLKARQEIVIKGKEILATKLTVGTWGNISCRVPGENYIAITPSGMSYETLVPEDIVIIDLNGNIASGTRKPSVEVPLHMAIYSAREDVQAVIHTHSAYASAMAVARKEIPGAVEDLVQIVGGNVRVNEYALPGTEQLGKKTVKALEGRNAVLLANHGVLGVGRDLNEALKVCQVVEKSAQIVLLAQLIGGAVELSQEDIDGMRSFYLNGYGQSKS
ncbi:ribulose-5-phosphate 4-epimerase-like epimerase or aldolase [Desulfosporosinus orientis DSM 765]|uniref:Ribulose-5-phosphate 4-epimerase-like epimerase or aldolase n=1 Tax=Desulfosporosinus orientis (strain ATCC 19365 / DSM 765 / NCIMB 8382 / VKM B-1628 / Singapore I) TaxID=768706 RepID=G7W5X4_DESOD|nr:class II aldolase/adducin family protein [Desulfosporosinus orientis]AET67350.1 ribulose-5-phosphate 4-epimerase-like epimerase or aldolase [Desulfosporosinus orientis DSM 765]